MSGAIVIIPTYNERENLEKLTHQLLATSKDLHILIIDDNSPDGTGRIAEQISVNYPQVHVIQREKKLGLGSAYIEGFHFALRNGFQYVITMDADFSHDPEQIPHILQGLERWDVIIGSRYITGGHTVNWSFWRKFISKSGNIMARYMARLKPRDCTSGYRAYRKKVLEMIPFKTIKSSGYSFLVEMLYLCQKENFLIEEIPIVFVDRRYGSSKISKAEIYKAFLTFLRLFFYRLKLYANKLGKRQGQKYLI